MFSIVYEHCLALPTKPDSASELDSINPYLIFSSEQVQAMLLIMQPFKFGTICFFVISGFLLGRNLRGNPSRWTYYKKRLRVIGLPYLIAFSLFFGKSIFFGLATGRYNVQTLTPNFLGAKLWLMLFFSAYWFIADFMVVLGLMLLLWRYTYSRWFGLATGLISLVYAINIYTNWFIPGHMYAVPAYVFYLWLGVYLARTPMVIVRIQQLPSYSATLILLVALTLTLVEAEFLKSLHITDPGNTLRFSNQLFSLAVFIWLMRHNFIDQLPFLDPRNESFGIYLYHLFFVAVLAKLIMLFPSLSYLDYRPTFSGVELAACTVARFLFIYTMTLMFVKVVNRTRFRWLLGNRD